MLYLLLSSEDSPVPSKSRDRSTNSIPNALVDSSFHCLASSDRVHELSESSDFTSSSNESDPSPTDSSYSESVTHNPFDPPEESTRTVGNDSSTELVLPVWRDVDLLTPPLSQLTDVNNAGNSLRQAIPGCASCYYKNNQTHCDLRDWSLEVYPELTSVHSSPPQPSPRARAEALPERRSMRIVMKESAAPSTYLLSPPCELTSSLGTYPPNLVGTPLQSRIAT